MLSLAQALQRRGSSGIPLPTVYESLAFAGADICRGQLTLIVGPPGAGKSTLAFNLIAGMRVPSLTFLLDTTELTASARFASIVTGDDYKIVKQSIIDGNDKYYKLLLDALPDVQAVFHAPGPEDVQLQIDAFEQRYGLPPDVVLVDNLGNQSSAFDNEWAVLKALTLELDTIARKEQCAIIAAHHTTDLTTCEPAARDKILGKITQYARLVFSVNYNDVSGEYKIAIVKNSEGQSDARAQNPVVLWSDPARMLITEHRELIRKSVATTVYGGGFGGF
jgi:archaellum biogenesis ATPase FlaH